MVVGTEDQPDCLKTNDGSTIPIIHVMDKKKRLNIVGDVNVHDEIIDITIQMEGPPRKKAPSPHVEEVIYSLPTLPSKPSTSTSYCAPSTSFTAPPDITKFVIVDPSTFRPEDLPPGTVLYRSVTPMLPMPQTSTPSQPPMPPVPPTGQVPMPYFSCDNSSWAGPVGVVQMPNIQISVNTGVGAASISTPQRTISRKHTERSNIIVVDDDEEEDVILID